MPLKSKGFYEFGPYRIDAAKRLLLRGSEQMQLPSKTFNVLLFLVESAGREVSKDELMKELWPDTFVEEASLTKQVSMVRKVLGENAQDHRFIVTVPGRGYRFIGEVRLVDPDGALPSEHGAPSSPPIRPTLLGPRKPRAVIITSTLVAATICVTALLILRDRAQAPQEPVFTKLSFGHGVVTSARFTRDGQTIYYGAAWDGNPVQLFSMRLHGNDTLSTQIRGDILSVAGDGRLALLLDVHSPWYPERRGALAIAPTNASAPRKLLDDVQDADFSPDGSALVAAHWLGVDCRLEYPIGKVVFQEKGTWISNPRVSPRGDQIAFLQHRMQHDDEGFVTVITAAGDIHFETAAFPGVQGLAWDPSGESVWFTANEPGSHGGRALFFVRVGDKPRLVRRESSSLKISDISADRLVLVARESLKAPAAGRIFPQTKERDWGWLDFVLPADISSDGSNILLSIQGEAAGQSYLAYIRSTRIDSPPTLLGEGQPLKISPDGKTVLTRFPVGPQAAAVPQLILLPTGAGQPQPLTHDSISHSCATWLPDGRRLVFTGNEPGHAARTWLQYVNGNPPAPITPEGIEGHWVSGNGKMLAAIDPEKNLWIYPTAGGRPRMVAKLDPDEEVLNWSADNRSIFIAKYLVPADVQRIDIATSMRKHLFNLEPSDTAGVLEVGPVLITPDAKSYVYNYLRVLSDLYIASGLR